MEEISARFEIIRLSFKMADYDIIEMQANRLKAISYDDDLEIISDLLLSKNYRQALFMMKSYAEKVAPVELDSQTGDNTQESKEESGDSEVADTIDSNHSESTEEESVTSKELDTPQSDCALDDKITDDKSEEPTEDCKQQEDSLQQHDDVTNQNMSATADDNDTQLERDENISSEDDVDSDNDSEVSQKIEIKTIEIELEQNIGPLADDIVVDKVSKEKENIKKVTEEKVSDEYPMDSLFGDISQYDEELTDTNLILDEEITYDKYDVLEPELPVKLPETLEAEDQKELDMTTADNSSKENDVQATVSENVSPYIEEIPEPVQIVVPNNTEVDMQSENENAVYDKVEIDSSMDVPENDHKRSDTTREPITELDQMIKIAQANFPENVTKKEPENIPDVDSHVRLEEPEEEVFTPIKENALKDIALDESNLRHADMAGNRDADISFTKDPADISVNPEVTNSENAIAANHSTLKKASPAIEENVEYKPIRHMPQKLKNMMHQFPQLEVSESGICKEVMELSEKITTIGYSDDDIYAALSFCDENKKIGNKAEAAQMLLLIGATESKFAQLMLARELFKGDVLQVDLAESFTQINRLAEQDYQEAICDLAQLYEFGYGIKKDKKIAKILYEEASSMGVERATRHLERLSRKKGIFDSFLKR